MKKKIISILLTIFMIIGIIPFSAVSVFAEESGQPHVAFYFFDEDANAFHKSVHVGSYTTVESTTTTWSAGWYIADGTVEIGSGVTLTGDVKLILKDGCKLTVNGGINVGYKNLTVYGQYNGTGELIANGDWLCAGIGGSGYNGSGGTVNIYGGTVTATGGGEGAGIGSGHNGSGGTVNIYGGTVTAYGGDLAAGIGGGDHDKCTVNIYGGTVTATGGGSGAGIGGGDESDGNVNIYGGTVIANGGERNGAGIGGGSSGSGGTVTINGGTVTATAGEAAGIGGGKLGNGGTVIINGGNVTAISDMGAGIGGGYKSNGDIVTINGGNVTAISDMGAGIGAGFEGSGGTLTLGEELSVYNNNTNEQITRVYGETWIHALGTASVRITDPDYEPATEPEWDAESFETQYMEYTDGTLVSKIYYGDVYYPWSPYTSELTDDWYSFDGEITLNERITVTGDVKLILKDGCKLTAVDGISITEGSSLTIYGQTNGTGELNTNRVSDNNAAISVKGTLRIDGGKITAYGGLNSAGIGGGNFENGGTVTINGGTVYAQGGNYGTGIGGGQRGNGGLLTVNGGTVTAKGTYSPCIGGGGNGGTGRGGNGGTVIINSGTVEAVNTATTTYSGIGCGENAYGGDITINGGTVTASGIGPGNGGIGGTVIINGGDVTSNGISRAGIGGGYSTNGIDVTINGGTVKAKGGSGCAGIGGGSSGNGGTVIINGGNVTATGGSGAAGIGAGKDGSCGGTVTITDGVVKAYGSSGSAAIGEGTSDTAVDIYGGDITADSQSVADAVVADSVKVHPDKCEVFNVQDLSYNELSGSPVTEEKSIADILSGYNRIHIKSEYVHTFTNEYVNNEDGTHSRKCSVCGALGEPENHTFENHTSENHICVCGAAEAHTWQCVDDKTHGCPVCGAVGNHTDSNKDGQCDACGYNLCSHNNTRIIYDWNNDYTICTAAVHCDDCGKDILTENAAKIELIEDTHGANCRTMGKGHYEATFETLGTAETASEFDTELGEHHYVDFVCEYCNDELLEDAKSDAIKALHEAVERSDDEVVLLLADNAENAVHGAETVAEVLKIKNDTIFKINAIATINAAAGNNPGKSVKRIVDGAKEDINSAESIEEVINIRDECLADIEKLIVSDDKKVKGITLSSNNEVIGKGDTVTLTATVNPDTAQNKNVVWSSMNAKVAKVEDGVVTALRPGAAAIVAQTEDGGYKDVCFVRVISLTGINGAVVDNENNLIYGLSAHLDNVDDYIELVDDDMSIMLDTASVGTGTTINVVDNGEIIDSFDAVIFGDVNGDGWYDGTDAMIVNCIANGLLSESDVGETIYIAADCNHDGVIDNLDVDILQQAGVLLADVDQSKSEKELIATSSAYVEYLNLIDQTVEAETVVEDTPTAEDEPAQINWFQMIISFLSTLLEFVFELFTL